MFCLIFALSALRRDTTEPLFAAADTNYDDIVFNGRWNVRNVVLPLLTKRITVMCFIKEAVTWLGFCGC